MINNFNYKIVVFLMGVLLLVNGGFMLLSSLISLFSNDGFVEKITMSSLIVISTGFIFLFFGRGYEKQIQKREGYLIVTLGWILMSITGTIPYIMTGVIPQFSSSFFESMSGYTTTGATIIEKIDSLPKGILFWRSTTHWIGGMGIIVLAIAILPFLGIGGTQLFSAEAPGPASDKLHPRITDTAKRLWLIYLTYTIVQAILLYIAGMTIFDAVNHAMSTISTGGFSTKSESIAFWNDKPLIQYIIIIFMFLAGTNFVLSYFAFTRKFQKIIQDEEFKLYTCFIIFFSFLVIVFNLLSQNLPADSILNRLEPTFRNAIFQVVTIITTTGFITYDFTQWTPLITIIF
ncbi:MAG: potassium transporter TrkG, partial [Bacteroidota bacterium]|nr:potassium transporter TrkG [Bacteroidota bacterium]